ncbi:MAG TPA: carboxypeptidase-like regulatory domain-containing protein [Longimicrobiales bacterium]
MSGCIDGMIWIGSSYDSIQCSSTGSCSGPYRSDARHCYVHEAEWRGCCRKVPAKPSWLVPGTSRVFLVHRDGLPKHRGRIFGYFVVHRVELLHSPRLLTSLPVARKGRRAGTEPWAELKGHVYCAARGVPIAGAVVQPESGGATRFDGTTTDERGFYRLSLAPGTWDLSADAEGYHSTTLSGIQLDDGKVHTQDLFLWPLDGPRPPEKPPPVPNPSEPDPAEPDPPGNGTDDYEVGWDDLDFDDIEIEEPDWDDEGSPAHEPDGRSPPDPSDSIDVFVDYTMFEDDRSCSLRLRPRGVYLVDALAADVTDAFSRALQASGIPSGYGGAGTDRERRWWIREGRKLFHETVRRVHQGRRRRTVAPPELRDLTVPRGELVLFLDPPIVEQQPEAAFRGLKHIDGDHLLKQVIGGERTLSIRYCVETKGLTTQAALTARLAEELKVTKALAKRFLKALDRLTSE